MRIKEYDIDLEDVDADGICASQTPSGAGNLTINGAFASGGAVTFDYPRQVSITSAGNDSGRTYTVTGTDPDGYPLTETITGPNATTVEGSEYFATVAQVAIDGAAAGANTVGTVDEISTQTIPLDHKSDVAANINVNVSGTIDFTVQETFDDVQRPGLAPRSAYANSQWLNISALATKTADTTSTSTVGATAIRLLVNSHSSAAELQMTVNQTTSRN